MTWWLPVSTKSLSEITHLNPTCVFKTQAFLNHVTWLRGQPGQPRGLRKPRCREAGQQGLGDLHTLWAGEALLHSTWAWGSESPPAFHCGCKARKERISLSLKGTKAHCSGFPWLRAHHFTRGSWTSKRCALKSANLVGKQSELLLANLRQNVSYYIIRKKN